MVTLRVKVPSATRVNAIHIFDSLIGPISAKHGCTTVNLYCDINNDDSLIFLEEWNSQSDLWRHIRSDDFLKILAVMDLANEPPEIRFHTVSSSDGFELVEKLREQREHTTENPNKI